MENINSEKNILRKQCLKKRDSLPIKNAYISDIAGEIYSKSNVVFCYVSTGNEIGTHFLISEILKTKTLVVPYCTDYNGNMICSQISSTDELTVGKYNIYEPKNPVEFDKKMIDFVIMPSVCMDRNNNRLGMGKGYYDRFLSDISPYKVALIHKELIVDSLPHCENDIKADKTIIL